MTVVHDDYVCRTGLTTAFAACGDMSVRAATPDDPELRSSDGVVTDFDNGMRILSWLKDLQMNIPRTKVAIIANADDILSFTCHPDAGIDCLTYRGLTTAENP